MEASAQTKKNLASQLRYQVEIGLNYTTFIGGIPGNVNGLGYTGIRWRLPGALSDKGLPFLLQNEYFSAKVNYRRHRIQYSYWSCSNNNKDFVLNKTVGLTHKKHQIYSVGYGYLKDIFGIKFAFTGGICYRIGSETVVHSINTADIVYLSGMDYQKPWGWMTGIEIEYLATKNLGIGLNLGYYSFPFEDAKLTGNFIESMNPEMLANAKPTKQLGIGTVKIIYNFSLPFLKTPKSN
ncbi:MAG: hypothetical protein V4590_09570 [Bacteroidota bacterium]